MRRRSRAGGEPVKARRRKTVTRKRPNAPKAGHRRSFAGTHQTELAQVIRERDEALEQQAAINDVLRVISNSPNDVQPVLDSVAQHAARICEARVVEIVIVKNEAFRIVASFGEAERLSSGESVPLDRSTVTGRAICDLQPVQVADLQSAGEEFRLGRELAIRHGHRTTLSMPLIREGRALGAILVRRAEVRPFEEKHIVLLKAFADQAAIAIENVRLFEAEQRRTRELSESLQQQTATADVLKVISRSAFDLKMVLDTLAESAVGLCAAGMGIIFKQDGDVFRLVANFGVSREAERYWLAHPLPVDRGSTTGRALLEGRAIHIPDVLADPEYRVTHHQELAGYRSTLSVPLLRDGTTIGIFALGRREPNPFTGKQIELVTTFADQAVIAIENARLLSELRERTNDLSESLEQQTATSEVLQVISSSPGDVQPVFKAMLQNAVRICDATFGNIYRWDGDALHLASSHKTPPAYAEYRRRLPTGVDQMPRAMRQMVETRLPVQTDAVASSSDYERNNKIARAAVELGGIGTVLNVPMVKENELVGAITLARSEVRPFNDKQIALVTNFARQAAIAIENARLLNELRESLQQQTATAEVLKVISRSTFDLQAVLDTLVQSAARLCEADTVVVGRPQGQNYHWEAICGFAPTYAEYLASHPPPIDRGTVSGRVLLERKIVHVVDVLTDPEYTYESQGGQYRTLLGVPLLREGSPIGVIALGRTSVRPFTDKQIELASTFADQAVIAIENVRLLNELRESLQQQTATADVLKVISRSTFDLRTVLDTLTESATRLCAAENGVVYRRDGGLYRLAANYGFSPEVERFAAEHPLRPDRGSVAGRVALTGGAIHIPDVLADPDYSATGHQRSAGYRTGLGVPLLREGTTIGVFVLTRQEVNPFTEKQIELVTTFADQAVIAIENARLLSELRESLQQQTATADVLKVISRSTFDLQTVLDTLVESAAQLCEADMASINREKGEAYHQVASYGHSPEVKVYMATHQIPAGHGSIVGRTIIRGKVVQIADVQADQDYKMGEVAVLGGIHTMLGVPLLRSGTPIGVINLQRKAIRPFTEKQIELAETFADQAVIAIENVRLLDELRHRTDELSRSVNELRALGEVSQTVNSTLDLETVLSTIVSNAVQLSGTEAGAIYTFDGLQSEFRLSATYGMDQELIDALRQQHIGLNDPNVTPGFLEGEPIQMPDLHDGVSSVVNEIVLRAGFRALLVTPLLRGHEIVGMLVVRRRTPGAFPQNTVELIKTFAAQSAVAIQNARLFENVDTRTRELARSLEDLRTAQDRLIQTEKLASLGQLTAGIAHEIKNPLNFVNNFSGVSVELIDELEEALAGVKTDDNTRTAITELANTLRGNLDKVVQHGKRADSIVKNMLLHSRQGSGEHRPADINALVEESLNLAYHGARAEKQGFNITLQRSLDPAAGQVDCFPQEITRVLLNLISNGFYAATKRKGQKGDESYEPTLAAATRNLGDRIEIRIRDNGIGIPPEVREKLFNPFFTTKPAGEGTGLGLSISHDIIVKQHAGSIEVDTHPGEFTEFRIVLPRAAASLGQLGGRA